MAFNSIQYLIFLPIVFLLYWHVFRSRNRQNLLILIASYVFYGWWNWRFLVLIFITSLFSFASGLLIERAFHHGKQKQAYYVSAINILINLGILGVYKYYDFFMENVIELLSLFGLQAHTSSLGLILPVGISFYTFQALGYSIDVYRRKTQATHDPVQFFAFLSFFPQLVAGPIESSTNLLPQFGKDRQFDYAQAADGMRQILWGLFKKMVIADNCATIANVAFNDYEHLSGLMLIIGALMFTFQIYGDFSGYSDIAIGSGKLFGFRLMRNFHTPYFSLDISDFWRRWHISLMRWFTEYVYFPLGGSRCSNVRKIFNILVVFSVSGLWHGAKWTFVLWGLYNGILVALYNLFGNKHREIVANGRWLPSLKELGQMWSTFFFVVFGWIIFRASSVTELAGYVQRIFTSFSKEIIMIADCRFMMYCIIFMTLVEWLSRERDHGLCLTFAHRWEKIFLLRWVVYVVMVLFILMNCGVQGQFIYFQF